MSRFGKAIERATGSAVDSEAPTLAPAEAPDDAVFETAWDVTDGAPSPPQGRPVRGQSKAPSVHPALAEKVATPTGAPTVALEQYRKLAAKLHQWQLDHEGKVVMMVSAVAGEGKTLTTVNLALTLSGSYQKRVLIVDCDLRRPTVHGAFQIAGSPGVADIVERAEIPVVAITDRLAVVPAGRIDGDPMGVLTSDAMATLLEHARSQYDWVLLDTAPLAVLPDANLLTDHIDGAVLVVSAGTTEFNLVDTAVRVIGKERILGVVLNGVDPRDMSTANYHADYYGRR